MKISLLTIGKTADKYLLEGLKIYEKRLQHYVNYSRKELPDVKNAKTLSTEQLKEQEGKIILQQVAETDELFLLDENGQTFSSEKLAEFIKQKMLHSSKSLVFVVGGAYGFSDEVYKKAVEKISLSQLTFSHQMVRLIFTEQIYRAFTIIKGEPYHHK